MTPTTNTQRQGYNWPMMGEAPLDWSEASRVALALAQVEAAQELLAAAAANLCPLIGAARRWKAVVKAHSVVKGLWYSIDEIRAKLYYDGSFLKYRREKLGEVRP